MSDINDYLQNKNGKTYEPANEPTKSTFTKKKRVQKNKLKTSFINCNKNNKLMFLCSASIILLLFLTLLFYNNVLITISFLLYSGIVISRLYYLIYRTLSNKDHIIKIVVFGHYYVVIAIVFTILFFEKNLLTAVQSLNMFYIVLLLATVYGSKELTKTISLVSIFVYSVFLLVLIYPMDSIIVNGSNISYFNTVLSIIFAMLLFIIFSTLVYLFVSKMEKDNESKNVLGEKFHSLEVNFFNSTKKLFELQNLFKTFYSDIDTSMLRGSLLVEKLSRLLDLSMQDANEIYCFSKIAVKKNTVNNVSMDITTDSFEHQINEYDKIMTRLLIKKHAYDTVLNWVKFQNVLDINYEFKYQIVFLIDLYSELRCSYEYKSAFSHNDAVRIIKDMFNKLVEKTILDRFIKFENEFCSLYDSFI